MPKNENDNDKDKSKDTESLQAKLEAAEKERQQALNQVKQLRVAMAKEKQDGEGAKSEVEQMRDQIAALQKEQEKANREAIRHRIALKKGLTESQAKRLVGETAEELEADADELLSDYKAYTEKASKGNKNAAKGANGRPVEKADYVTGLAGDESDKGISQEDAAKIAKGLRNW